MAGMGFTLAQLQNWDKMGRKKGFADYLTEAIAGLAEGAAKNRGMQQTKQKLDIAAREEGFVPKAKGEGLGAALKRFAGLTSGYEYDPKAALKNEPVYVVDPMTGDLKMVGEVPSDSRVVTRPRRGKAGESVLDEILGEMEETDTAPIRVRRKSDNQTGTIPANEFDAKIYERI